MTLVWPMICHHTTQMVSLTRSRKRCRNCANRAHHAQNETYCRHRAQTFPLIEHPISSSIGCVAT